MFWNALVQMMARAMGDGSIYQRSHMDWMWRRSHSLPSTVVSCCQERGQLRLSGKYLTGVHYTGGGEGVAKVTRNFGQGLEGPSADLGNCMRYPQEALQEHDWKSRGHSEVDSERAPALWHPLSLWRKEMTGSQKRHLHLTISQPQEWHVGWCGQRRIGKFSDQKNGQDGFVLYVFIFLPQGIQFVAFQSEWPLRFGWIVFLPLLQWASEPEVPDISESFPKPVVLVRRPAVGWEWLETRGGD